MARGFSQRFGVDYYETFASTPNISVIRFLLAFSATRNLFIRQIDIKTAFLHGELKETVYMNEPPGFVTNSEKVWLLKKSLYGLKQAPREWYLKFTSVMQKFGLRQSMADACLYFASSPCLVIVLFYVDDALIFSEKEDASDKVINFLKQHFELHELMLETFLGFQIERPSGGLIKLHQKSYVAKEERHLLMESKFKRILHSSCRARRARQND